MEVDTLKIHMVRNGFWLWYEIAILWYEMVNYGTKWQWYEMVMVRNDLLRLAPPIATDIDKFIAYIGIKMT
jgi:hypothetical protein